MFDTKLLTADPIEHVKRAKIILQINDDSLLRYASLELRLAIERIIHNQLSLSPDHTKKAKGKNDPVRKKLIMKNIDPDSDHDYDIFYKDPKSGDKLWWGEYKNIPQEKVNAVNGRLGNLLHMQLGLNLGIANDPWYKQARAFLNETVDYLEERTRDSCYYFSYTDLENYEFKRK